MEVWQCSKCHGYTPGFIRFCKTCGKEYCYETDPFSLTSEFVSENDVKEIAECYGLEHQLHILQEELELFRRRVSIAGTTTSES